MDTIHYPESVIEGVCECCPNTGPLYKYIDMLMCKECYTREQELQQDLKATESERLQAKNNIDNIHFEHIRQENAALKISTDIFNAKIKSISELKTEIDNDLSIENKNFTLARVLAERFQHLSTLLFSMRQEIVEHENEQRAIQTFYNELSKKLRIEEREKIKLADLTYQPAQLPVKIKKEPPKKKWDKTGVAAQSLITGIQEQLIQMVCAARDITPEAAVMILKEQGVKGKK